MTLSTQHAIQLDEMAQGNAVFRQLLDSVRSDLEQWNLETHLLLHTS